jgi:hypothetical protein
MSELTAASWPLLVAFCDINVVHQEQECLIDEDISWFLEELLFL